MPKSKYARKQRKAQYNAPIHTRRKNVASHLSDALAKDANRRSALVIKGDTVRILRGDEDIVGTEGKVTNVNTRTGRIVVEGVTMPKADGTMKARPVHASNVVITKLELTDPRRKRKLQQGEERSA
jgi:large subunit ribosomal protein L24